MKSLVYFFTIFTTILPLQAVSKPQPQGISLLSLLEDLEHHRLVQEQAQKAQILLEKSKELSSWGDPRLRLAAVNLPSSSLSANQSMMSGYLIGINQTLPLTKKYGHQENYGKELANTQQAKKEHLRREYAKILWGLSIDLDKNRQQTTLISENLEWINNMISISKKHYANGKIPQQAILDLQIRRSELIALKDSNNYADQNIHLTLNQIMGREEPITLSLKDLPWEYLERWQDSTDLFDFEKRALQHQLKASEYNYAAQRSNTTPDITVGVNYINRNNLDGLGDFVSFDISIPIPSSKIRGSKRTQAMGEKLAAEKRYHYYLSNKKNLIKKLTLEIKDTQNQLSIIKNKTIKYAKSSRDITAKSYRHGGADYLELLKAELQYLEKVMKKIGLEADLKNKQLEYLFIMGDSLLTTRAKS